MIVKNMRELVRQALVDAGPVGVTSLDLSLLVNTNVGATSSMLSKLNRLGECARLATKRDGHSVYVLPECTEGRSTVAYGSRRVTKVAEDGFRRGYDMGLSAGILQATNKAYWDGYNSGWNVGAQDLAHRMEGCLDEMLRAIRGVYGLPPFPLSSKSWMTQPQHTIDTMRRFIRNNTKKTTDHGIVDLTERRAAR